MPSTQLDQGISLLTGKVTLPLNLVTAPGQNGLDIEISIFYDSSNVSKQVKTWNNDAPTGVLGLGWSLPQMLIMRDTHGTGATADDSYYLIHNGADRLIQIGASS